MPGPDKPFVISAPAVFDGGCFLHEHCVVVRGDSIEQVLPMADCPSGLETVTLAQGTLAPGFIDLQVNGGGGVLFNNNPERDTLLTMQAAHRSHGTTGIVPTLLSDTPEIQQRAAAAVREALQAGDAGILGMHLEGPFFNPARAGAHNAAVIRSPEDDDIAWLCSLQDVPLLLTLAPEQVPAEQLAQLANSGIIVCAGHTQASFEQMDAAAKAGLSGVTHLFNAMQASSAREPGTVGAALGNDQLWAGIIADGHHVHPQNIRLAHGAKPAGKLLLVSDAMATVGSSENAFELYGETIHASDGRLVNTQGKLAGSAIGLIEAVAFACSAVKLPLEECLRMASLYPASVLGLQHKLGKIKTGYRADLVHFDQDFSVHHTWLAGHHQQH
jgi:N-acetylglucosamine-6-phosphate deacetylase